MTRLRIVQFLIGIYMMNVIALADDANMNVSKEINDLKIQQQEIKSALTEIKNLLITKLGSISANSLQLNIKDKEFDIGSNPTIGKQTAKFILLEFSDYQCKYCSRHVQETLPQIKEQFVDKGIIRYGIIDNPLIIHKLAPKAAEASHCAQDQGKYWEMHNLLMNKQDSLENLSSLASLLKLDISQFESCLAENKYKEMVAQNVALSQKLGVKAAPIFIIGMVDSNDSSKVKGISFLTGAQRIDAFKKEIDQVVLQPINLKP